MSASGLGEGGGGSGGVELERGRKKLARQSMPSSLVTLAVGNRRSEAWV